MRKRQQKRTMSSRSEERPRDKLAEAHKLQEIAVGCLKDPRKNGQV